MSDYFKQNAVENNFDNSQSWVILSPIEQSIKRKIEAVGTPLRDWDINIYRGITTGLNDAFIISGEKKDELIAADPKSAEIIRPILRGRDIKRYGIDFADLWIINVPWHFPFHNDNSIQGASVVAEQAFKDQYPAIYEHLLSHKEKLSGRNKSETGVRYEWYALQRWGANYSDDFSRQKIVWGNLSTFAQYAIAGEEYFINAPSAMIVGGNEYILAALNSKILDWYFKQLAVSRNGGYYEYKPMFIEQLPIPKIESSKQQEFVKIVIKLMNTSNKKLEKEIDEMIFKLYDLNDDEIDYIMRYK